MTRTVLCRKYGENLPGLETPPIPGALGEEIYETVSAKAWQEWLELQTMLINEHHLSMLNADARKYLAEQRQKFLAGEDHDRPEGYVPKE